MIKEDPITLAEYAAEHHLLDLDQWKQLRPYHRKRKYIRKLVVNALAGKTKGLKYKFGVLVPNDYHHAKCLDQENGNYE